MKGWQSCDACGREIDTREGWTCRHCHFDNKRNAEFARNYNMGHSVTFAEFAEYSDSMFVIQEERRRASLSDSSAATDADKGRRHNIQQGVPTGFADNLAAQEFMAGAIRAANEQRILCGA